jgi:ribosomal protein L37E
VTQAVQATVTVSDLGSAIAIGSGFIIHPEGLVITARHVVDMENRGVTVRRVKVRLWDDRPTEGFVFRSDNDIDYALIWLREPGPYPVIPLGDSKRLRFGETVFAVGSPKGFRNTVSKGIVANPKQVYRDKFFIQTDAAMYHGNSGGPLFNRNGAVGIVSSGLLGEVGEPVDNLNFAIPLDYLAADIELAIARGKSACLAAVYCVRCGRLDFGGLVRTCPACGYDLFGTRGRKKPQLIDEILAACDSHTRSVYKHILEEWKALGHRLQAGIGGVSLKAKIKGRTFGLASLRSNLPNGVAVIILGWEGLRRESVLSKEAIDLFQAEVVKITALKVQPTTAHIIMTEDFTTKKADALVKAAAALVAVPPKA